MYYERDEFFRLMESIEKQGGTHLDKIHEHVYHADLVSDTGTKGLMVVNCGESALFEVPYEALGNDGVLTTAEVCAVDDRMGLWPRFADAVAPGVGD